MSQPDDYEAIDRADFLRLAALGATGLSLAAVTGCGTRSQAPVTSQQGPPRGYVVAVTHGPEDPARVLLALVTATRLPRGDNHVWFAIDGGQVCKREIAEQIVSPLFSKQGNAATLLDQIQARGTAVHI